MSVASPLNICILNAYPAQSRKEFDDHDVGHPSDFFKDFLSRYAPRASVSVIYPADPDPKLPAGAAIKDYDAFMWTGSDLTAYHFDDIRVTRQIEFASELFWKGGLSYGSCWGLQISASAAGGEVRKNPKGREWAIAKNITLTAAGKKSRLLKDKPKKYQGFIMHLDEVVRLPTGVEPLSGNAHSGVQALEIKKGKGEFWSCQYHPEYNLKEMARLMGARAASLVKEGHFPNKDKVLEPSDKMRALHVNVGDKALRAKLGADDSILDPGIREIELRNWVDFDPRVEEGRVDKLLGNSGAAEPFGDQAMGAVVGALREGLRVRPEARGSHSRELMKESRVAHHRGTGERGDGEKSRQNG